VPLRCLFFNGCGPYETSQSSPLMKNVGRAVYAATNATGKCAHECVARKPHPRFRSRSASYQARGAAHMCAADAAASGFDSRTTKSCIDQNLRCAPCRFRGPCAASRAWKCTSSSGKCRNTKRRRSFEVSEHQPLPRARLVCSSGHSKIAVFNHRCARACGPPNMWSVSFTATARSNFPSRFIFFRPCHQG